MPQTQARLLLKQHEHDYGDAFIQCIKLCTLYVERFCLCDLLLRKKKEWTVTVGACGEVWEEDILFY